MAQPIARIHEQQGTAVAATIMADPDYISGLPSRTDCMCIDAAGRQFRWTCFGPFAELSDLIERGQRVLFVGKTREWNGQISFTGRQVLPQSAAGGIRPLYPKAARMSGETVRKAMGEIFDQVLPQSAAFIEDGLPPGWQEILGIDATIAGLLRRAHFPWSMHDTGAVDLLRRVNRLFVVQAIRRKAAAAATKSRSETNRDPARFDPDRVARRFAAVPFALTQDQQQAIDEILGDLQNARPMRRLLTGDVGTGKTVCYLVAAAAMADAGRRAAVVLPSVVLADQVYRECRELFPDLEIALLISGAQGDTAKAARIVIGTTAVLHDPQLRGAFEFAVFDEQQRFSRAQRQGRRGDADGKTVLAKGAHRLEVSATPIPASMSLLTLGYADTSRLRQGHAAKRIATRIWHPGERGELYRALRARIEAGDQVAVVYPLKDEAPSEQERSGALRSAKVAAEKWETIRPGRVRLLHGEMPDDAKRRVLADLREGRADVLVSTTVIEVGVTIPGLRTMLVAGADRLGLSQLHQLRGRLARTGGDGWFHLLVDREDARERFAILEETTDGFRVADADLRQRGMGGMGLVGAQSGKTHGFVLPAGKASEVEFQDLVDLAERIAAPGSGSWNGPGETRLGTPQTAAYPAGVPPCWARAERSQKPAFCSPHKPTRTR